MAFEFPILPFRFGDKYVPVAAPADFGFAVSAISPALKTGREFGAKTRPRMPSFCRT
jgi:hypothetical protein